MRQSPPSFITLAKHRSVPARARRPTVALLLDYMSYLDGAYQSRIGETFHEAARKLDVDLLMLFGRALEEPSLFSRPHNGIFDLVEPRSADGVVMVSTVLAAHCGIDGVGRFAERYRELARVSVGVELPGVPSVIVDNQRALEEVVDHVVTQHGCRRVAFLAGTPDSPESEARLLGYQRALARHGLPFDPALVGYGRFMHWPARALVGEMLDRAGSFDALVAANDSMALGAIAGLRERGLRVPGDVVVTGFDDIWLGRLGEVALTTVSQPFERIAEQALSLVLKQLAGDETEPVVAVPADVLVRRSCGCALGRRVGERPVASVGASSPALHLEAFEAHIAALINSQLDSGRPGTSDDARRLFDALKAEVAGQAGAFLNALQEVLNLRKGDHDRHQALHNLIDALREDFRPVAGRDLEDVWYEALSRIANDTTTAGVERRIDVDNEYSRLLSTADRVSVALDLPTLGDAIAASLQNVGIATAFVSRFAERAQELEPLTSLFDGARSEAPRRGFPAVELIPPDGYPSERRRTLVVFPLVFETQWLGVAAFEHTAGGQGYQMLRDQFAAALGHVTLHQQILSKTMLHERSVQERQATTRRLEALSVLAGGVAHDLNNTLGPLVALPEIAIEELSRLEATGVHSTILDNVLTDIQCIKSAGSRAAQTIKDLLTLGRQGRTTKESLDLNQLVEAGLRDPLRLLAKSYPNVTVTFELHRDPLLTMASEAHVTRAITNLARNAAEAMGERAGEVVIRTDLVRLTEALSGYETIAPGEYATVSVADTGNGIPAAELGRVFEPFFSRKRMGEQSGSGLGLAIVHGVAKEHEGFVDLRSTPGRGTTFTLYFPTSREPSRIASVPPPDMRASARILVVEDDPIQRRTARRVLSHLGYEVEVMDSGARALELVLGAGASARGYDVLLLDVMLNEELDGLQILRRIRRALPDQRAVVASGQAERGRTEEGLETGVSWVAKPYTTEGLAKAIQAALSERDGVVRLPVRRASSGGSRP